jgi:lipopolysaccharide/colanic/teichoic acid biosynthesis glycosyltransferase
MTPALNGVRPPADLPMAHEVERARIAVGELQVVRSVASGGTAGPRLRRLLNVVSALIAIALTAPLMLLIAALVKLTSPGPVIYKQTRVGIDRRQARLGAGGGRRRVDYGGRLFTIYKFRTMRTDPQNVVQIWARPDDDRVTPIGRVLRKLRLDELPQLFNVLRGDMNLVGPRPEQPRIFMELRDQVPGYAARQRVLPGITGWAQVNHHYDQCVDDVRKKLRYDLEYLARESTLLDLLILIRTLPVMVGRRGGW